MASAPRRCSHPSLLAVVGIGFLLVPVTPLALVGVPLIAFFALRRPSRVGS